MTTCGECGAKLDVSGDRTFVRCAECGATAILEIAPPWALSGLDYVAPPPPSARGEPPPPLRRDHAPVSHPTENVSPLSGELVEGEDLVYVHCSHCGKEFEGDTRFLRCPFCSTVNTVDTAPPWAILVEETKSEGAATDSSLSPPLDRLGLSSPLPAPPLVPSFPLRRAPPSWAPAPSGGERAQRTAAAPTAPSTQLHSGAPRDAPPGVHSAPRRSGTRTVGVGMTLIVAAMGILLYVVGRPTQADLSTEPLVFAASTADQEAVRREVRELSRGLSCAEAARRYPPDGDHPEIPDGPFNEILGDTHLEQCQVPERTGVEVCAVIRDGRALGVTVMMEPPDPLLADCVAARVRMLEFPHQKCVKVIRSRFPPLTGSEGMIAPSASADGHIPL